MWYLRYQLPVRWLKNCDKGEPRELAGEPNTAAVGFFSFCLEARKARAKKDKGAAMRKAEEPQKA